MISVGSSTMHIGMPTCKATSSFSEKGEQHSGHRDSWKGAIGEPAANESGCSGTGDHR